MVSPDDTVYSYPMSDEFDGRTFDPALDGQRLGSNQNKIQLWMIAHANEWHTADEIATGAGVDPKSAVKERIRDCRKPRNGSCNVEARRTADVAVWQYRIVIHGVSQKTEEASLVDLLGIP